MTQYALSLEAQHDIEEIRAFYLNQADVRVARRVLREIEAGFQFVAVTPGVGHVRPDLTDEKVRFWRVFSYLIVYDPAMQPLGIARVVHASCDLRTLFGVNPPRA